MEFVNQYAMMSPLLIIEKGGKYPSLSSSVQENFISSNQALHAVHVVNKENPSHAGLQELMRWGFSHVEILTRALVAL
jgi:hypothetical protein